MISQYQQWITYRDTLIQTLKDEDADRGSADPIVVAIITVAMIGLAVALVALLWAAFNNRSAGLE